MRKNYMLHRNPDFKRGYISGLKEGFSKISLRENYLQNVSRVVADRAGLCPLPNGDSPKMYKDEYWTLYISGSGAGDNDKVDIYIDDYNDESVLAATLLDENEAFELANNIIENFYDYHIEDFEKKLDNRFFYV